MSYSALVHHPIDLESNDELARQWKKFSGSAKFNLNSQEVYCICRKPDTGELMVGCDGCDEWYHFKCMKLDLRYKSLVARFYCKFCRWKGKGTTLFKRKCRLDSCWNPIAAGSKYCSRECGRRFFERLAANKEAALLASAAQRPFDEFRALGNQFPELPQVEDPDANMDKFPECVRAQLVGLDAELASVSGRIAGVKQKMASLALYKDKTRQVNEQVSDPDKSKKKRKKIELCLYDQRLRHITSDIVERFDVDDVLTAYKEGRDYHFCIQEKRKCARHNGWLNLINDEFAREIRQLDYKKSGLQQDRQTLLRNYSIDQYEK